MSSPASRASTSSRPSGRSTDASSATVSTVGSNALHSNRGSLLGSGGKWMTAVPRVIASKATSPVPPRPRGGSPSQIAIKMSQ